MADAQPLISPGWSHYIITAPLSPKARVNLNRKLRGFSDRDRDFKPLAPHALSLPLLDLGVLPSAVEPRLSSALSSVINSYASIQVHAGQWVVGPTQAGSALWLTWSDRLGALDTMRRELERALSAHCPEMRWVEPNSGSAHSQKRRADFPLLCGALKSDKSGSYTESFRGSAWLNEVCLKKRPQHFDPSMSYQSVWRHTLPLETPALTESELDLSPPSSPLARSSDQPLTGRELELLEALEHKLEQIQQQTSSQPSQPQRRRRRSRHKRKSS